MSKDESGKPITKHTLFLFDGDYARLNELFPQAKAAKVIRKMVRNLIERVEGGKPDIEIDIDEG
jgi:hypothetical protein